ncbi:unnamed protein product, partial [Phaeothamnion confervicola]
GRPIAAGELVRIDMPLVPAVLYAACRWLRTAVVPADFARWCADGTLPYFNAYASLPEDVRAGVGRAAPFFAPRKVPLARSVAFLALRLGMAVGAPPPPLNFPLVAARFARALGLPAAALDALAEVFRPPG